MEVYPRINERSVGAILSVATPETVTVCGTVVAQATEPFRVTCAEGAVGQDLLMVHDYEYINVFELDIYVKDVGED